MRQRMGVSHTGTHRTYCATAANFLAGRWSSCSVGGGAACATGRKAAVGRAARHRPLGPQLESLGSELNLAIQQQQQGALSVLRLHASLGFAVKLLPKHLQEIPLDLQYYSPQESLAALNRGSCDVAGFHLPRGAVSERIRDTYQGLLKPCEHRVIGFIARTQGLMVAPGNPLGITGVESLINRAVRFVNHQAL